MLLILSAVVSCVFGYKLAAQALTVVRSGATAVLFFAALKSTASRQALAAKTPISCSRGDMHVEPVNVSLDRLQQKLLFTTWITMLPIVQGQQLISLGSIND